MNRVRDKWIRRRPKLSLVSGSTAVREQQKTRRRGEPELHPAVGAMVLTRTARMTALEEQEGGVEEQELVRWNNPLIQLSVCLVQFVGVCWFSL
jgi:hypothetical protein